MIDEHPKRPRKKSAPKSVQQRPAAYRFTTAGDKIDVLPEPPEPLDRQLAEDTQQELRRKARELLSRLHNSSSARRVCDSVQRLMEALDVPFGDLRPGLLLSHVRSLEADGAAFDTEDARAELFPDAFARVSDTVNTARDLLGVFPEVRRVEVERLALDLHRLPDKALPTIEEQANEIERAAQKSRAATQNAVQALARNDAAINAATDPVLRTALVADKLLVIGNFARAAAGKAWAELGELGAASWGAIKENLPKGIGAAAREGPLMALWGLTAHIVGPVAGVAAAVPAWKSLSGIYKKIVGDNGKASTQKMVLSTTLKTADELLEMVLLAARKRPACETSMFPDLQIAPLANEAGWELVTRPRIPPFISHECQLEISKIAAKLKKKYRLEIVPRP